MTCFITDFDISVPWLPTTAHFKFLLNCRQTNLDRSRFSIETQGWSRRSLFFDRQTKQTVVCFSRPSGYHLFFGTVGDFGSPASVTLTWSLGPLGKGLLSCPSRITDVSLLSIKETELFEAFEFFRFSYCLKWSFNWSLIKTSLEFFEK